MGAYLSILQTQWNMASSHMHMQVLDVTQGKNHEQM